MSNIIFITGVSGSGKSTVGSLLSKKLSIPFFDADDYHPRENIKKMSDGIPLTDQDRHGWLTNLNELSKTHIGRKGCVIACSALKKAYRVLLSKDITQKVIFVFLEGTYEVILDRMKERSGHFMPASLLKSQFDILEIPENGIVISIQNKPETIVDKIVKSLPNKK
ncbi:gluconokinase [Flavobacteriaceae bacterium M23B6Z8]